MTDVELDAYMDASAAMLGLRIEPAWRDSIRFNLATTFRLGAVVLDDPLDDEAEPAPVFEA